MPLQLNTLTDTEMNTQLDTQSISRFETKEHLNRQVMEDTLADLAAILYPQSSASSDIPLTTDPDQALLMAAGAVGKALGIAICPPAQSEDLERVAAPIEAIARASQVRMRRVTLRDNWWQKDGGPILAYRRADHCPVALLPTSDRGYELLDSARANPHPSRSPNRRNSCPNRPQLLSPLAAGAQNPEPDAVCRPGACQGTPNYFGCRHFSHATRNVDASSHRHFDRQRHP